MTRKYNIKSNVQIEVDENVSKEMLLRINSAILYLRKYDIKVVFKKNALKDGFKAIIRIIKIGDISDEQIKELFKIIFSGNNYRTTIKLIDGDKEFLLPKDIDECLDWFIIEK